MAQEILCSEAWAPFDPAEVARAGAGSYALPSEIAKAQARASARAFVWRPVAPSSPVTGVQILVASDPVSPGAAARPPR